MDTVMMAMLRCENCGGAMAPDQGKSMYVCPYCASVVPFTEQNYYKCPPIRYRHRARQIEDDTFSVLHTRPLVEVKEAGVGWLSRANRLMTVDEKLKAWGAVAEYADIAEISFACCHCGGKITGEESQNMFVCAYCGSRIARSEAIVPGAYKKRYVLGRNGVKNLPGRAVPFVIGQEQAISAAGALIRENRKLAGIRGLESYVRSALHTAYLPFSLIDLSYQIEDGIRGERYYQEYINWACPESVLFDVGAIDRLEPWDFSTETAFDPAFMDGDTRAVGMSNMADRRNVMGLLLQRRIIEDIRKATGKTISIRLWGHDYRPHNALILLPVFWADMRELSGKHVCAAVNGQTGKAVVQVLETEEKEDYIVEGVPRFWKEFSQDSTMINVPVQIRSVGGSIKWVRPVRQG